MIKIVVDTNVFVSSFFGGKPRKIIELWRNGELTICLSAFIVDEYIEILSRLGLRDEYELKQLLKVFAEGRNILFTANLPSLEIVRDDPDDDKFIECAVALDAECIVSGDKHLKSIGNYMSIRILSPTEFLEFIASP